MTRLVNHWAKATTLLTQHAKFIWHSATVGIMSTEELGHVIEQMVSANEEEKKQETGSFYISF